MFFHEVVRAQFLSLRAQAKQSQFLSHNIQWSLDRSVINPRKSLSVELFSYYFSELVQYVSKEPCIITK